MRKKKSRKVVTKKNANSDRKRSGPVAITKKVRPRGRSEPLAPKPRAARPVFVWTLAVVGVFAALGALSFFNESWLKLKKTQPLNQKLTQVSTFSFPPADDDEITLAAVGDILPARYVEFLMRKSNDYTLPFKNTADFLQNADIAFGNLESPLLPGPNVPKDSMTFRADLRANEGLSFAGFDVLSLANNHTMNYQVPGLTSTIKELRKAEILPCGGGKNQDTAHTPAVIEVKGKRVAFHCYVDESIPPRRHGVAKIDLPGIAAAKLESVKSDVANALKQNDIVIVSMHAGTEYKWEPTQFQKDFAHAAIDAGAAVVIGHHPHVMQPVEKYKDGYIFYSLGNFVFDQFWAPEVQKGLVTRITFDRFNRPDIELFPVQIDKTVPRFMEGEERAKILEKLGF